jgi:hypothetical protein
VESGDGASPPEWYYLDPKDNLQGPFPAQQMVEWVETSLLKSSTRVCGVSPKLGVSWVWG